MKLDLHNLTNHYQDVKLISLSSWRQAHEIVPRDHNGPYVILQEGYDPEDPKMIAEEFVLGRSCKWLSLGYFYRMPIPERRAEFLFGTVAEVIELMSNLPSKAEFLRPAAKGTEASTAPAPSDGMMEAFQASRAKQSGSTQ